MDQFQNRRVFSEALKADREETIRLLMEIRVDELLNDGRKDLVECLTRWALDGINLGDDQDLLKLAEGLFECDDEVPAASPPA